jgi:hypothetical protein
MNAYKSNRHQSQPHDVHNVEHHQANPQAAPPQPRASAGCSNTSCTSLNRPAHCTTFQKPANAGYESYLPEVYHDMPDSFYSSQELEPEMYKPVIEKQQPMSVPPLEIKFPVVDPSTEVDLVPHILATGLRIGFVICATNMCSSVYLTQAEPIP